MFILNFIPDFSFDEREINSNSCFEVLPIVSPFENWSHFPSTVSWIRKSGPYSHLGSRLVSHTSSGFGRTRGSRGYKSLVHCLLSHCSINVSNDKSSVRKFSPETVRVRWKCCCLNQHQLAAFAYKLGYVLYTSILRKGGGGSGYRY